MAYQNIAGALVGRQRPIAKPHDLYYQVSFAHVEFVFDSFNP
jgi:hypothetical protein